jgi:hypothetical protein
MDLSTSTRSLRYIFTNKSHTIELEGHWLRVIGNYVCGYFVAGTTLWARVVALLYGLYAVACAAVSILPRQAVTHSECGTVRSVASFHRPTECTDRSAYYRHSSPVRPPYVVRHHRWYCRQYTLLHFARQCSAVRSVCRSLPLSRFVVGVTLRQTDLPTAAQPRINQPNRIHPCRAGEACWLHGR